MSQSEINISSSENILVVPDYSENSMKEGVRNVEYKNFTDSLTKFLRKSRIENTESPREVNTKIKHTSSDKIKKIIKHKQSYSYKHFIYGEEFNLEILKSKIYLTHPKWSFVGEGNHLIEAEMDVIEQVHEIADDYIHISPSNLTFEALKMRDFIFKVIG